jgi:hypothetical protein
MIGFLIKKSFYDLWDNLFKAALINLGFIISLAIFLIAYYYSISVPILGIAAMLFGIFWCCVYLSAAALSFKAVSDYGNFCFMDFFHNLKTMWRFGLFYGALVLIGYVLLGFVIPFYLSIESVMGLLLAVFVFWLLIITTLALQFFFAIRSRLGSSLGKTIMKCFIIFFDNPLFCIFSLICSLFMMTLSIFTGFMLPGPAGVFLFLDEGLRLRLMKYDWLETNPETNSRHRRRKIPWDSILIEEREKTGNRSLRNLIFPWKD